MPGMRVEAQGLGEIICHCLHKVLPPKLGPQSGKEANIFTFNLGHGFILGGPPTALVLVAKHCSALTPRIFSLSSTAGLGLGSRAWPSSPGNLGLLSSFRGAVWSLDLWIVPCMFPKFFSGVGFTVEFPTSLRGR